MRFVNPAHDAMPLKKTRSKQAFQHFWQRHKILKGGLWALMLLANLLQPGMGNSGFAASVEQPSAYARTDHATIQLIAEDTALVPGKPLSLLLQLTVQDGWHSYWRNPGDSGLATQLSWTLPDGLTAGDPQWPYPERINTPPLVNYGYSGETALLTELAVSPTLSPGGQQVINLQADWLVCKDICVPEQATLSLSLPVAASATANPEHQEAFARARAQLPQPKPNWSARASLRDGQWVVQLHLSDVGNGQLTPIDFFPIDPTLAANSPPPTFEQVGHSLTITLPTAQELKEKDLPPQWSGVLLLQDSRKTTQAFAITADIAGATSMNRYWQGGEATANLSWGLAARALLLALLGGIVLNLMPCVFPVLALKVLGFVKASHHHHHQPTPLALKTASPRRHALWYSAGVVSSMLVLAGLLILLQLAGQRLGWGFQLQSPAFVTAMVLLFTLISFSLFGFVEWGQRFSSFANRFARHHGSSTAFATGVLATLVATPCTGPFMAIALGLALSMPPLLTLLIFVALGAGLALPVVVLSSWPSLLQRLPRPGAWMEHFKQLLGFPLLASALWLLWVLGRQQGMAAVFHVLTWLLLAGFTLWAWGRVGRWWRRLLLLLSLLAAFPLFAPTASETPQPSSVREQSGEPQAFTPEKLAALQAAGKPVLVNFTADWCLTCKVNEASTLGRDSVQQALRDRGVTYLVADWTNRDAVIAAELAKYQRTGVPLYILFWPGQAPQLLPQLLTPDLLLAALSSKP
jgi:thiol:disulfide interchange protein DsbD